MCSVLVEIRGLSLDSEGRGFHFLEINILTLKMLKINHLSSSGKKIDNPTLTFLVMGEERQFFEFFFRLASPATVKFSNIFFGSFRSH